MACCYRLFSLSVSLKMWKTLLCIRILLQLVEVIHGASSPEKPVSKSDMRLSLVRIGDECKESKECPEGAVCHHGMGSSYFKYCVCRYGRPRYTDRRRQICPEGIEKEGEAAAPKPNSAYEKNRKIVAQTPAPKIEPRTLPIEERQKIAEDYYSIPDEDDPRYMLGPTLLRAAHRLINQPATPPPPPSNENSPGKFLKDYGSGKNINNNNNYSLTTATTTRPGSSGSKQAPKTGKTGSGFEFGAGTKTNTRTLQELIEQFIDLLKARVPIITPATTTVANSTLPLATTTNNNNKRRIFSFINI